MGTRPNSFEGQSFEHEGPSGVPPPKIGKFIGKEVAIPPEASVIRELMLEVPPRYVDAVVKFVRAFPKQEREMAADMLLEKLKSLPPQALRNSKSPLKDLAMHMEAVTKAVENKRPATGTREAEMVASDEGEVRDQEEVEH